MDRFYRFRSRSISAAQAPSLDGIQSLLRNRAPALPEARRRRHHWGQVAAQGLKIRLHGGQWVVLLVRIRALRNREQESVGVEDSFAGELSKSLNRGPV